ncbi:E3 ubiquitin-protein ligase UBR2 [Lepeophtheirus salmonis]|uniref:E3 ubiquitin-protein ligase UBR2 n=1 Tax=Lepeophtheirus salmonis TaxID=72036 RepID=UPI001AE92D09|nr:E3 ubiquitin-protein ligase UBR2-like [Lepeophtheirus salmonis]
MIGRGENHEETMESEEEDDIRECGFLKEPKDCLNYLNLKLKRGCVQCEDFREIWSRHVSKYMSPGPEMDYLSPQAHFDEEAIREMLLYPLSQFICQSDPEEVLEKLSSLSDPPSTCGKRFRMGEAAYTCCDCGIDHSCVLCVECFQKSEHRFHKYKMGTSNGGGYCDCGDTQAWTAEPYCETHALGASYNNVDPLQHLPSHLQPIISQTFMCILKYAHDILTLDTYLSDNLLFKKKPNDLYTVVVYNDEIHGFDDVINTLPRAVECDRPTAVGLVTIIDREGRALVKSASFQDCSDVKKTIERITSRRESRPLKVIIMPNQTVAHQTFALRLLDWVQDILSYSDAFKAIFASVILKKEGNKPSLAESFFRHDTILWKQARSKVHHLLLSGMLYNDEIKCSFARLFTRCYGMMMKDFINDDLDHSFSITSLTIQLFSIPSLAHRLIGEDDVFANVLQTFISECEQKRNHRGKIEFPRGSMPNSFLRSHFILQDVKYLLTTPPDTWNDNLRKGFLHGLDNLLKVLSWMQGMDSQVRQTTRHVEFELRWDSAFHLQMKLNLIISSLYSWAESDRIVFIKTVRLVFKTLYGLQQHAQLPDPIVQKTILDQTFDVIDYQVSTRPISIHFPVTRVLAGLSLSMQKYDLDYDTSFFQIDARPDPLTLIELPVRTVALIAQVQAGMWRLNGDSVADQLRTYHLPNCCGEMFDKDIIMLQWGASLLYPDHFIVNLVSKYQLINWASPNFNFSEDDSIHQIITLVEDLFITLIFILGERYKPGVGEITKEKALEREIIQLLCVGPMSFSAIMKSLPDGHHREVAAEKIIKSIATFKKPTLVTGKGYFELKPEYFSEYNVFYYHYTREEHSKSEEAQRKRKSNNGEPECNPPPRPPPFTKFFSKAAGVLRSRLLIYLMALILKRADNLKSRCFSENQVHRVLHLIGICLYEQERYSKSSDVPMAEYFTVKASEFNLFGLMETLIGNQRISSHKDLLNWTIKLWKKIEGSEECTNSESDAKTERVNSEDESKRKRAEMAKARRMKLMEQMKSAQVKFMKDNVDLLQNTVNATVSVKDESSLVVEDSTPPTATMCCLGPSKSPSTYDENSFTCILCQEEEVSFNEDAPLVMAALVQKSTVLWKRRKPRLNSDNNHFVNDKQQDKFKGFPLLTSDLACAPHVSSCGHIMHASCWQKYHNDIVTQERLRSRMRNLRGFDVEKGEFICPLCRCINNTVIPIAPQSYLLGTEHPDTVELDFSSWIQALKITLKYKKELEGEDKGGFSFKIYYTCPMDQVLQEMPTDYATNFAHFFCDERDPKLMKIHSSTISEMANLFSQFTSSTMSLDSSSDQFDERKPLMVWLSCAYTIHSSVWSLLDQGKSIFGSMSSRLGDCLKSLVCFGGIIGSSPGLTKVVRSHTLKILTILLESWNPENYCILELDAFGILVSLSYALPSLFRENDSPPLPSANAQDLNVLKLMFIFHTVQIFLTTDRFSPPSSPSTVDNNVQGSLIKFLRNIRETVGFVSNADGLEGLSEESVLYDLKIASLPFLRCSALFYHNLSCVPAPTELKDNLDPISEFDGLSKYLGLPSDLCELFNSQNTLSLAVQWASHPGVKDYLSSTSNIHPLTYPIQINHLVDLPSDYSEFINAVSSFKCPKSLCEESRYPAMCLICGTVLCSQSYCCQTNIDGIRVGACNAHAQKCSAGFGIFLRVRECKVIIISGMSRGCIIDPPYVDQYGETDMGFRRRNPLSLCPRRYKEVNKIWLNHGIPEEISYSLETSHNFYEHPWQDL